MQPTHARATPERTVPAVVRRGVVALVLLLQVQAFGAAFLQAWRPAHSHVPVAAIAASADVLASDTVIAVLRHAQARPTAHTHAGVERHHHAPGTPGVVVQRARDDLLAAEGPILRDRDPPWPLMPSSAFAVAPQGPDTPTSGLRDYVCVRVIECPLRPPRRFA